MYRLLAIAFAVGFAGIFTTSAQAACRQTIEACTSTCPVQQGEMANGCTPSCRRFIICDAGPDRLAKSRLPKTALPQGRLPQSQLPRSRLPASVFN
jgi:hypothetical protein